MTRATARTDRPASRPVKRSTAREESGEGGSARSDRSDASSARPACRSPGALLAFILLAIAGLTGDLLTKHYVFRSLVQTPTAERQVRAVLARFGPMPPDEVLHRIDIGRELFAGVRLTPSTNAGVVFGRPMPRLVVLGATAVAVVLVLWFFLTAPARAWAIHVSLALVLGGALGNLYDRLLGEVRVPGAGTIRYQVRDFVDCSDLYYPWIFNVADVLLVVGVAILAVCWLAGMRAEARHRPADREA